MLRRRTPRPRRPPRLLRPRGPYTQWFWPRPPGHDDGSVGFSSFEHTLTAETDPGDHSCCFWAHQFRTVEGEGGYVGLQTWGNRADGSLGKMAIFSLWDALEGRGPGVVPFSGEGEGWSCRIPFAWESGRPYRLRIGVAETAGDSVWWAASVDTTEIGRIRVPRQWGRLRPWSVMWTEYYGPPVPDCAALPYACAVFSEPVADGGSVRPERRRSHVGDGDCHTTRVADIGGGVRQELGIPPEHLRAGR